MDHRRAARVARVLLPVAGILGAWALLVAVTGGVFFEIGSLRISSRNPVRPALLSLLFASLAWRLAYQEHLDARLRRWAVLRTFEPLVVCLAAGLVLALGVIYGTRAAGGSDQFGYVSQSALWRAGELHLDNSIAGTVPWPDPRWTFTPLAYRPSPDGRTIVPTYAAGLPLMMAGARNISPCALYFIGPICGAALVLLTYVLGRRFFSRTTALLGSLLTAASPAALYMSMSPMADVPTAVFWIAALAVAGPSPLRLAAAGMLAGIAVTIRPNLVPLALFPWLLAILDVRTWRPFITRTVAFAAGIAPFAALVAWVNNHLYGSPLVSGYGSLAELFAWEHGAQNIVLYPSWWLQSQSVLGFLFLISLVRLHTPHRREAGVLMAFAIAVYALYLFYLPFEVWWYLRFLIPAIPVALLFCVDAVEWAASRSPLVTVRAVALVMFTAASLVYVVTFSQRIPVAEVGEGEEKYTDAGVFVDRVTPPNAVIISMQHSGSIRYYSGRTTLRYDYMDPEWLDRAVEHLEARGRPVYLLLDEWEVPRLRERFPGQRTIAVLDGRPDSVGRAGKMVFYGVGSAPLASVPPRMPRTSRFQCQEISPGFVSAGQADR